MLQSEETVQKELIGKSRQNLKLAMEDIRKLVVPKLESFDLKKALDVLTHDLLSGTGISFQLKVFSDASGILTEEFKIILYRIMQEQLTNIIKYAGTTFVTISIQRQKDIPGLVIIDYGKGFDPLERKKQLA